MAFSLSSKLVLEDGAADDFVGDGGLSSSRVAFSSDGSADVSDDGSEVGFDDGVFVCKIEESSDGFIVGALEGYCASL